MDIALVTLQNAFTVNLPLVILPVHFPTKQIVKDLYCSRLK